MTCYPNTAYDDAFKSHLMNQSTDYHTYFDTRSLDRERASYGSTPSSKSSMSSTNQSSPMTPSSCERGKSSLSQLTSDRIIASWHQPETGSLKSRSRAFTTRQSTNTHAIAATRPGTPMVIVPTTNQPISKRSTLPSSFKLASINEPFANQPPKTQRRQTTLRAAGLSICEDRAETHIHEEW